MINVLLSSPLTISASGDFLYFILVKLFKKRLFLNISCLTCFSFNRLFFIIVISILIVNELYNSKEIVAMYFTKIQYYHYLPFLKLPKSYQ